MTYKFFFKLPSSNCVYTEYYLLGNPSPNSTHNYRLECEACGNGNWYLYIDGSYITGMYTGWNFSANGNANGLVVGGEVGGHNAGIGMQGAISNMRYKRGATWYVWNNATTDNKRCDFGYRLIWNGPLGVDDIFDWGYTGQAGQCPA